MDQLVSACTKHKEKLKALKDVAEGQKEKIAVLREQKSSLQYQVDQLIDDLEIEKKFVYTVQIESAKRMNKIKDELQHTKEDKKLLVKDKDENCDIKIEMEKLNDLTDQRKKELKEKEFEIEELVKKVNFLKPKLEACLKDTQSKN